MASNHLIKITKLAKKLRREKPHLQWQAAIAEASRQLKAPAKKAPAKKAIAGKKKPAVTRVNVRAKTVKVAGIGCTSRGAFDELNNCIKNIEQLKRQCEQLTAQMKAQPVKERVAYRKEIAKNKKLQQAFTKQKAQLKRLV